MKELTQGGKEVRCTTSLSSLGREKVVGTTPTPIFVAWGGGNVCNLVDMGEGGVKKLRDMPPWGGRQTTGCSTIHQPCTEEIERKIPLPPDGKGRETGPAIIIVAGK